MVLRSRSLGDADRELRGTSNNVLMQGAPETKQAGR